MWDQRGEETWRDIRIQEYDIRYKNSYIRI